MKEKKVLVISNGHGEDIIAANILNELLNRTCNIDIKVLPIVGVGKSFKSLPVDIIGPSKILPSGGFMRNSLSNFISDIKAGLLSLTIRQIKAIRQIRDGLDLVIPIGDVFILILAGLFARRKTVFIPTAKSEYISGHYSVEEWIMKKYSKIVLPRDNKTAEELKKAGVNACFVGNAMMDCFEIKNKGFDLDGKNRVVGILPGSREEAYDNIKYILKILGEIELLSEERYDYLIAMASNLTIDKLIKTLDGTNWFVEKTDTREEELGIYLRLISPEGNSIIRIIYHHFGDVLDISDIFIGLAGTANEQAVGMGKPLISFPGKGSQFTEDFAQAQKSLLGESVLLMERKPREIAVKLNDILNNRELYNRMGEVGRERMGNSGGIKRMVDIILEELR